MKNNAKSIGLFWLPLCIIFSFSSFAQADVPYQLIQAENDTYRDYTLTEFEKLSGTDSASLHQYQCDGVQEFAMFPGDAPPAGIHQSLRVQTVKGEGPLFVYQNEGLVGVDTNEEPDAFEKKTFETLQTLAGTPSGKILLAWAMQAAYPITISQGMNRFEPRDVGGKANYGFLEGEALSHFVTLRMQDVPSAGIPFTHVGVGGYVSWVPDVELSTVESDGVSRVAPLPALLGHELYHAFESTRGVLDVRFVWGPGYQDEAVAEYKAVYFENHIRKEIGGKYRKFYGSDDGTGSMLDASGNPILIPAPCLTQLNSQ